MPLLVHTKLSIKAVSCLAKAGITHTDQLAGAKRAEIARIPGIGPKLTDEIVKFMLFSGVADPTITNGTLSAIPLEVITYDAVIERCRSRQPFRTAMLWGYRITANAYGVGSSRDFNDDGEDRLLAIVNPDDTIVMVSPTANRGFIAVLFEDETI